MSQIGRNTTRDHVIHQTFSYGVIYIYSIPDSSHHGRLKIGGATVHSENPTQAEIDATAHERIKQQTKTADIRYILEHAELAITDNGEYFSDRLVHNVLLRSGVERKSENTKNMHSEWFEISLNVAQSAIKAVKEGRRALKTAEKFIEIPEFDFRPNQLEAIEQTTKAIKRGKKSYLWNAKMRFGKTSTAMELAKRNDFKKILILTHRPSVHTDWYDDFNKVFVGTDYQFSSSTRGEHIKTHLAKGVPFAYFASMQDLRLSRRVVEDEAAKSQAKGFEKNEEVFDTTWDMLIIDEAHEGTQRDLGKATVEKIHANFILELSGTPFNILHKREADDIYTWDYVMEQRDKKNWDVEHPGEPNPYAELPELMMFTYDVDTFGAELGDIGHFQDATDGAFRFHEFFRVHKDTDGNDTAEFVHETMVKKFLDLLVDDSLKTKFPYSTEEYRGFIKHSLWLLPNRTKVIEAMEHLLKKHPVFGKFGIVNISGNRPNDDDEMDSDAKSKVTGAIKNSEYTITLTGQRLTTGASIPEWTAVMMLSDTSSVTTYLQTAFRCQTPAKIDGKLKTQGYLFDFAPDRTLKLVAEAIELNHKSGKTNTPEQRQAMQDFLNFCPIIAANAGSMRQYDVGQMLNQLKKAIIERVSRNGFDDPKLYLMDELMKLDEYASQEFNDLKAIVGASQPERVNEVKVNDHGMTDLQREQAEELERKKKKKTDLTDEEKERLKRLKEAREQSKAAITILRAVSIRMPMLVYGADVSIREEIAIDQFIDLVDDTSWEEFMPKGLTKQKFRGFTKYYDEDVFKGVAKNIRAKAFDCDQLLPEERIEAIAEIFSTFKNPDKETVLTPWNVVNMHINNTLGGADFTSGVNTKTGKPEWVTRGSTSIIWSDDDTAILEINSKSGLYPLLAAYNLYNRKLIKQKQPEEKVSKRLWAEILKDNIYVLCKSPMAKSITERTLAGYTHVQTNIIYIPNMVDKLREKKGYNLGKELQRVFRRGEEVKFTAVVGNPPYQEGTDNSRDNPIYPYFMDEAYKLADIVTLITPARFLFDAGQTSKTWNEKMLQDEHLKVVYFEQKSSKVFPNTDIKGGVAITFRNANKKIGPIGIFTPFDELNTILQKVISDSFRPISGIIFGNSSYKFSDRLYLDNPSLRGRSQPGEEKSIGTNIFDKLPEIFFDQQPDEKYICIYGRKDEKRIFKWIKREYIENHPNLDKWKVFVPKSNGTGALGEVLSTPLTGEPLIGGTQTFISFGAFDNEIEAQNCMKYIKTKFSRVMLGTLKITQHNPKSTWRNVPLQDFTAGSDIDWSQNIKDIDKQLYEKYKLSKKEIDFIETKVKVME